MPTISIPYHAQSCCSAEKSVEECLVRLPGSKELDWEKKPELGTCPLKGLLLFSLPNSAVINRGFTLSIHIRVKQRRLLQGSILQGLYFPLKKISPLGKPVLPKCLFPDQAAELAV